MRSLVKEELGEFDLDSSRPAYDFGMSGQFLYAFGPGPRPELATNPDA